MKVLMLGWELPPHHAGGMGIACYQMCKGLSAQGVDIEFILPYAANFDITFMKISPAHHQTVDEVRFAGGVYDSKDFGRKRFNTVVGRLDLSQQHDLYAHNVAKLVESKEFDVIHAHDWLTFKAAMLAKAVSGKPMIAHVHATQFDQSAGGSGNPEVREIEYAALMMADQVFTVSQHTKNVIVREYGVPADKIHVVHNSMEVGSDIDESYNLHRYLETMKTRGYKVVVNAGRKTIQKGLAHLLESAAKVIQKNPKVLFLLAGGGEQHDELTELAAHYGISENVIFEGWMNGTGKPWRDTFRIADVFVMPSVSEPFGLAALEAIGYGAPVIVSKQSGVGEVLKNCFKVDFWDTNQMADMILSVCENEGLARSMWEESYIEYQSQSWKKSVSVMKHRYHHAIGAGL
ncbi:glycosyltransferase family 4 protein [Candidatus Saccharibacteria bacterium]|nr:glycosyltransferase family 4 protein [Candidatus Saccharibacteria bacterium]MCA9328909.1 glycosyltransferase family 4 protein [Candidatus Saccharibacteria bacterium]